MSLLDESLALQSRRARAANAATSEALRLWRTVDPQELDAGWARVAEALVTRVSSVQVQAAGQSIAYMDRIYPEAPTATLVPQAFSGVTLDGRELGPAMYGAVTTTKSLTERYGATRAFEAGASFLATVVGAAIQDLGRQADGVLAVGKGYTHYVRVLSPGACSRCAVLAGKSSYKIAFRRHLRCHCSALPVAVDAKKPEGVYETADEYFDSLSKADQDRVFTKAGAEAIRNGADINKIVNARRGAYGIGYSGHYNVPVSGNRLQKVTIGVKADGTPLQVYATTEGTTVRGDFGRKQIQLAQDAVKDGRYQRTQTIRLMPEQIAVMAGDDPARWRKLLIRYGYLD